jgi:hypothetical protein
MSDQPDQPTPPQIPADEARPRPAIPAPNRRLRGYRPTGGAAASALSSDGGSFSTLEITRKRVEAAQAARKKRLSPELLATKKKNLAKAQEALKLKQKQVELVKEKVAKNLPITPDERALLLKSGARKKAQLVRKEAAQAMVDAAAALVIKPSTVEALRLVVEQTAARHAYNPIDELIRLSRSDALKDSDKVAIHKSLMPYLIPQAPGAKPEEAAPDPAAGPKITIKNFVVEGKPARPIHETKREEIGGPEILVEEQPAQDTAQP